MIPYHRTRSGVLGKDSDFLIFQMGQNKRYFCLKSLQFRAPKGNSKANGSRGCKIVAQAFNIEETSRLLGFHHKVCQHPPRRVYVECFLS